MQLRGQIKPPLGIVFDSDMGTRAETALALALLYGLDGKNECRVVCTVSSRTSLLSAAYLEVVGRFYSGAVSGAFGSVSRTLPVGLAADGKIPGDTPMLRVPLERKTADGAPQYVHGIDSILDTAEAHGLIRNALTAQHDQNAAVVLAGPPANLLKLLTLPGSKELVAAKVRYLVCVQPEAAKALAAAGWTAPIHVVPDSVGKAIAMSAASLEERITWSETHPVLDAVRASGNPPPDCSTAELAAVYHAVRATDKALTLSEPAGGIQQVMLDPAEKERLAAAYLELVTAKPVPRQPRFRRPVVEEKKPEPVKPEPAAAKP